MSASRQIKADKAVIAVSSSPKRHASRSRKCSADARPVNRKKATQSRATKKDAVHAEPRRSSVIENEVPPSHVFGRSSPGRSRKHAQVQSYELSCMGSTFYDDNASDGILYGFGDIGPISDPLDI